jgi:hypothetical protein
MELNNPQGRLALVIIVLVVLAAGWFLWNKTAPPLPTVPPGQTLANPFGTAQPGPSAAPSGPAAGR